MDFDETAKVMRCVYMCLHIYIYKSKNSHE